MPTFTTDHAKAFALFMADKYGTVYRLKADADEMTVVAKFLGAFGITDATAFMERFATTIGHTIYLPFTVGTDDPKWAPWTQIQIIAHEHQHVIQLNRDGPILFGARYTADKTWRATYEGEGYRTNMALNWWKDHSDAALDVTPFVRSIEAYGLGADEKVFFASMLKMSAGAIRIGGVPDEAARVAIAWLNANG